MKELLKEIWLGQIKEETEEKEIIRKYGREKIKEAEIKGFIRVRDEKVDRKSTRLNSSHTDISRMPSSA